MSYDIAYGGDIGFNHAVQKSINHLKNVQFIEEKILIQTFFKSITEDNKKYSYGQFKTIKAFEDEAVETVIVWEHLQLKRYILKNAVTNGFFKIILYI